MSHKVYNAGIDRLRSSKRLEMLEVNRVVALSMEGLNANSLLDVGTGTGVFAEAFAPFVNAITGIDTNPDMIEAAKAYVPSATFQHGAAESIPLPDNIFDIVFLGHVLHESDDPMRVLNEARRCATQRVVVLEWPYTEAQSGPPLAHRLSPETITEIVYKVGFDTIETLPLTHMVLYRLAV